jgi:hypothetical protein
MFVDVQTSCYKYYIHNVYNARPPSTLTCILWYDALNFQKFKYTLYTLMVVPCIAGLCIENQHCVLGFVNVFITNAAPTCLGTYVPSSGSVFVLVST